MSAQTGIGLSTILNAVELYSVYYARGATRLFLRLSKNSKIISINASEPQHKLKAHPQISFEQHDYRNGKHSEL